MFNTFLTPSAGGILRNLIPMIQTPRIRGVHEERLLTIMTNLVTPSDMPSGFVVPAYIEALRYKSQSLYKQCVQLKATKQPYKSEFDLHRQYHKSAVKMYAEWLKFIKEQN